MATTFTYTTHPTGALTLDIIYPTSGPPPFSAVLWISGGGWSQMGKGGAHRFLTWLVDAGFAIVPIEYRVARQALFPAQVEDLYTSWQWLSARADSLQLDPARFSAMGDSAGGHLASLLASQTFTAKEFFSLRRVVALMSPMHLLEDANAFAHCSADLLGHPPDDNHVQARAASPRQHFTARTAPHLFIHGDRDTLVPPGQSRTAHQRLRELGVHSEMVFLPGVGHDSPAIYGHRTAQQAIRKFLSPLSATLNDLGPAHGG